MNLFALFERFSGANISCVITLPDQTLFSLLSLMIPYYHLSPNELFKSFFLKHPKTVTHLCHLWDRKFPNFSSNSFHVFFLLLFFSFFFLFFFFFFFCCSCFFFVCLFCCCFFLGGRVKFVTFCNSFYH